MWTGNVSPVIRQKAKGTRPARNKARRAARRMIVSGYPIEPRDMSLEEIRSYFAGDRLTCLRCGKAYKKLGLHILRIHALTPEDYKKMYGLPMAAGRGLCGSETKEKIKASCKLRADREGGYFAQVEDIDACRKKARSAPKRPSSYHIKNSCENLKKARI